MLINTLLKNRINKLALAATATLLTLILISPQAFAAIGSVYSSTTTPTYLSNWGSSFGNPGSGNGQFDQTYGVAVAGNGNIYATDANNNRVEEFTSSGAYINQWGSTGSGNGKFSTPYGIAVSGNDNVYVTDSDNNRVEEFTSSGTYITQFGTSGSGNGQFDVPAELAIASNGNVYVVDYGNNRIEEFTSSGTYITQFGTSGSGNGQFNGPIGVAIDANNNVYVADLGNNRIEEFTSSGTYITQFGTSGSGNGQFNGPYGIGLTRSGNVLVSDTGNNRIEEFTSSGTYVTKFGSSGTGAGQIDGPAGIAVGANGIIYLCDAVNNRIDEYSDPNNLGTVTATGGSSTINIALPAADNITDLESAAVSKTDGVYSYPLGLVDFTTLTSVGASVPVTLTFQTNLTPNQVTARKYNPNTQTYQTIPNAIITETTLGGQPALQLSYNVTDGGILDTDGSVNGIIVDPVGLATSSVSSPTQAPNTGYGERRSNFPIIAIGISAILSIIAGLALMYRKKTERIGH